MFDSYQQCVLLHFIVFIDYIVFFFIFIENYIFFGSDQQEKPSLSDPTERMRDTNVKFTPASAHKGILAPDIYSKTSGE